MPAVGPGHLARSDASSRIAFGLALPNYRRGATAEGIDAAAAAVERLEWEGVWSTDHVLVGPDAADEYGHIFEALVTLAYVAGRSPTVGIGTSVLVVPQRNAVVLAKELASLDVLSRGRLTVGVGLGWNEVEFGNIGASDAFRRRGAYLGETIALWRHLWGGSDDPFEGRFHRFRDVAFEPRPARSDALPIWIGGRTEPALKRAGRLADGYQSSQSSPAQLAVRVPVVRAAAEEAGRPMPVISARVRAQFGPLEERGYALAGTPEQMLSEIDAFAAQGVSHLLIDFGHGDPERVLALLDRFHGEVVAPYRARPVAAAV